MYDATVDVTKLPPSGMSALMAPIVSVNRAIAIIDSHALHRVLALTSETLHPKPCRTLSGTLKAYRIEVYPHTPSSIPGGRVLGRLKRSGSRLGPLLPLRCLRSRLALGLWLRV